MTKRLFVALNLPPEIKGTIALVLDGLKEKNKEAKIKWVKVDILHLTLHFLGDVSEQQLDQLTNMLKVVVPLHPPLTFQLESLGAFPNLEQPKVIFAKAKEINHQEACELQQHIGTELKNLGFKVDNRDWKTHITVGRVKIPDQSLNLEVDVPKETFSIKAVDLMESELLPDGPKHSLVQSFSLKGD